MRTTSTITFCIVLPLLLGACNNNGSRVEPEQSSNSPEVLKANKKSIRVYYPSTNQVHTYSKNQDNPVCWELNGPKEKPVQIDCPWKGNQSN